MAKVTTAERVSREVSDNYVFQRSLLAYHYAAEIISGDVLEIGTGTGYGVEILAPKCNKFVTVDKFLYPSVEELPNVERREMVVPPINFENSSFDYVVCFQVIEHIKDDMNFVREVARVLRPGGKFIVSTPNAPMSLTRNPWHVREYNSEEFQNLLSISFAKITISIVNTFETDELIELTSTKEVSCDTVTSTGSGDWVEGKWILSLHEFKRNVWEVNYTSIIDVVTFET